MFKRMEIVNTKRDFAVLKSWSTLDGLVMKQFPILELRGNWIWNTSSQPDSARLFSLFSSLSTVVRHDVEKSLRQTRGTACFATRSALGFVAAAAYAQALNLRLWEWRVVRATKDSIVRLAWSASRESDCKHSTSSFRETKYFFIPSILVDKLVVVHLLNCVAGDSFASIFFSFPPTSLKKHLQIVDDRLIKRLFFIFFISRRISKFAVLQTCNQTILVLPI